MPKEANGGASRERSAGLDAQRSPFTPYLLNSANQFSTTRMTGAAADPDGSARKNRCPSELGHLLLGEAGHPAGASIMHVPWQTKELERIKQGAMFFLPEQAETIRAQVLARTR
jgi:hypothetical protein